MKFKKAILFVCVILLLSSMGIACRNEVAPPEEEAGDLPERREVCAERRETLFITGMAWGAPGNFNLLSGWPSFPVNRGSNAMVYEPLFLFNNSTRELEPMLATAFSWLDEHTVEVKMNKAASFRDGVPVTAHDVKYTFDLGERYWLTWSGYRAMMASIDVPDDYTVIFNLLQIDEETGEEVAVNRLSMYEALSNISILPKHIWEEIEAEHNNDQGAIGAIFMEDPIGSGPYRIYKFDETRIISKRNDNWWGQEQFGLPRPRVITHLLFVSNEVAALALGEGDLDYSENFVPSVWTLKEETPTIATYLAALPFYLSETIPTLFINVHKPGLDDIEVRRALAYAIDYAAINEKAMTGYSAPMEPALIIPSNAAEAELVDLNALEPYQWNYNVDKANQILDNIGAVKGDDGIRVLPDGTRLGPWYANAVVGWTDWNAALEIVAHNAEAVGIEIITNFTEWSVWNRDLQLGEFYLSMATPAAYITPANPWKRASDLMSSADVPPVGEKAFWNFGRFYDTRANEIVLEIPTIIGDEARVKELWTELNLIYLRAIPSIGLMYRPTYFYTVNESIWRGFPREGDDLPAHVFDGAGIRALFEICNEW